MKFSTHVMFSMSSKRYLSATGEHNLTVANTFHFFYNPFYTSLLKVIECFWYELIISIGQTKVKTPHYPQIVEKAFHQNILRLKKKRNSKSVRKKLWNIVCQFIQLFIYCLRPHILWYLYFYNCCVEILQHVGRFI